MVDINYCYLDISRRWVFIRTTLNSTDRVILCMPLIVCLGYAHSGVLWVESHHPPHPFFPVGCDYE